MTGLPAARDAWTMRFWASGTSSGGSSTPRSPRATMTASDRRIISSRLSRACGFSSFESTQARPWMISRASITSSGRWTNDRPIYSTPRSSAKAMSSRSFFVRAGMGRTTSGTLTPLRSLRRPPLTTMVSRWSSRTWVTRSFSLPSSSSRCEPIWAAAMISGWGRLARRESPGVGLRSRRKGFPLVRTTAPPMKRPTRSFGPCTSARMPIGCLERASRSRIRSILRPWSSWLPCEKLSRKTSAPAWNSCASISALELAGPRVATILVLRRRRIFNSDLTD